MLPCAWSKTLSPEGQWNVGVTSVVGTNCIGVHSPVLCWVTRSFFFRSTCCKGFGPFAVSQRIVTLPFAIEKNTSRCVAHALGIRVYTFMLQSFFFILFFFQARVLGHSQLPSKDHESPSPSLHLPPFSTEQNISMCLAYTLRLWGCTLRLRSICVTNKFAKYIKCFDISWNDWYF